MKILHTADLHLKKHGDERWQALQTLLQIGEREQISLLAISGDLFDQGADLLKLQDRVREAFSGRPFTVLVLPGNHDYAAYSGGIYLGANAVILTDWETPFAHGDLLIWGLPHSSSDREGGTVLDRLHALSGRLSAGKRHLLLYHGELLDTFYARQELGDEGAARYMPVKLSHFQGLPFDYVLAGHFHTNFTVRTLDRGGYFVYPGSPVSITRRETGRRKVNLFTPGGPPGEYRLDTPHYATVNITLDPFAGSDPLAQLAEALDGLHPAARLILTVSGYIDGSRGVAESDLAHRVEQLTAGRCAAPPELTFQDIRVVLEDDLFKSFLTRLDRAASDDPARRARQREFAVRAMMEAKLC
ncbi:MAG: metallophosphoesterase [Bacillota bacterium]